MKYLSLLVGVVVLVGCTGVFSDLKDVDSLENVDFVMTMEAEADFSNNVVYCSTLGYVWDTLRSHLRGDIVFSSSSLLRVDTSTSYLNTLNTDEVDFDLSFDDNFITVEANLENDYAFEIPFVKGRDTLMFEDESVECFSIKSQNDDLRRQVKVLYYQDDKNFCINLETLNDGLEMSLARFEDELLTFNDSYHFVQDRIVQFRSRRTDANNWRYYIRDDDELIVPVLDFDLKKSYTSLAGELFTANEQEYEILQVSQQIAFRLDKEGASVKSSTYITAAYSSITVDQYEEKPHPKKLIFDKPFLVMLKNKGADYPYFMAWVNGTELMKVIE